MDVACCYFGVNGPGARGGCAPVRAPGRGGGRADQRAGMVSS
jgi:hypothetical protein